MNEQPQNYIPGTGNPAPGRVVEVTRPFNIERSKAQNYSESIYWPHGEPSETNQQGVATYTVLPEGSEPDFSLYEVSEDAAA